MSPRTSLFFFLPPSGPSKVDVTYKNQFETGTSGGALSSKARTRKKVLFASNYDSALGDERPKYGNLNILTMQRALAQNQRLCQPRPRLETIAKRSLYAVLRSKQ